MLITGLIKLNRSILRYRFACRTYYKNAIERYIEQANKQRVFFYQHEKPKAKRHCMTQVSSHRFIRLNQLCIYFADVRMSVIQRYLCAASVLSLYFPVWWFVECVCVCWYEHYFIYFFYNCLLVRHYDSFFCCFEMPMDVRILLV